MNDRDSQRIKHILNHYKEMQEELQMINDSFDEFSSNLQVCKAIKMDILQMGEHANQLSDEIKLHISKTNLKGIINLRNFVVHDYVVVNNKIIWKSIHDDLPNFINEIKNISN